MGDEKRFWPGPIQGIIFEFLASCEIVELALECGSEHICQLLLRASDVDDHESIFLAAAIIGKIGAMEIIGERSVEMKTSLKQLCNIAQMGTHAALQKIVDWCGPCIRKMPNSDVRRLLLCAVFGGSLDNVNLIYNLQDAREGDYWQKTLQHVLLKAADMGHAHLLEVIKSWAPVPFKNLKEYGAAGGFYPGICWTPHIFSAALATAASKDHVDSVNVLLSWEVGNLTNPFHTAVQCGKIRSLKLIHARFHDCKQFDLNAALSVLLAGEIQEEKRLEMMQLLKEWGANDFVQASAVNASNPRKSEKIAALLLRWTKEIYG